MSDFDPPPYIGKLISAINDGAKSAQLGAVAFVFIGLFLLATSFSATDEDLLIGKSISISQLGGVTVPVVLSFGFMPAIFLALHLYTLIRFDLLMQNLRHFEAELRAHVPLQRDRDRCLQLLANTEFIQAQLKPEASFVFRWTYRFMLAVFPVGVLLLVQLSSLRLQDHVVNIIHHLAIALDLLLLIWFFWRQKASSDSLLRWLVARGRFVLPVAVLGFDLAWCHVPSVEATTVGPDRQAVQLLAQPVDLLLCRHVKIGCRYLAVPGRPLVGKVWDSNSFVELRAGEALNAKRRAAFDPLVLQGKRLRFADLSGSQLFAVDLSRAELQGARLVGAQLQGARLEGAQLQGARLDWAHLQGATLDLAQLQGASLQGAELQGASLDLTQLQDASLVQTQLQGARLEGAQLQGARLEGAQLQGAWLDFAQLQGASLDEAELQGALLDFAQLQGASLDRAQLQGASLNEAQLQGASLDKAHLQGALITDAQIWRLRAEGAMLDEALLQDLTFESEPPCPDERNQDGSCPNPLNWQGWVQAWTDAIPAGELRARAARRLSALTAPQAPDGAEAEGGAWHEHPAPAAEAVANRLGALACRADHAPHIAPGILRQIGSGDDDRKLGEHRRHIAARMLSDDCPGARGLNEDQRGLLTTIAAGRL
ncbi:MAG: pentapeptide repeat-containing protein [Roseomonas sp.]|nr:pentapeptide repeat-containing protein [Roseomonas sp.]